MPDEFRFTGKPNHNLLKATIEKRYDAYHDYVISAAQRVLEHIIKPFCDKHKLRFYSGMGTWSFQSLDIKATGGGHTLAYHISSDWDAYLDEDSYRVKPPDGYEDIRRWLTMELPNKDQLFEYMEDYTP